MPQLKINGLFTLPMVATGTNKGGMFLWCGLRPFVVVWWNFEEILQHYKKGFSSSLNVTVGYFCMQSLPEWAGMFVSELERQRAILEDRHHHTYYRDYKDLRIVQGLYCPTHSAGPPEPCV